MLKPTITALSALLCVCANASESNPAGLDDSKSCSSEHWVAAWRAVPTDGLIPGDYSFTPLIVGPAQTFRSVLSPTGTGTTVRVQISNRFGRQPLVIDSATIGKQAEGAAVIAGTLQALSFSGRSSVTVPVGTDILTDPVTLAFAPLESLSVSVSTSSIVLAPTHHFLARQTSYATFPGLGDHTGDVGADAFVQSTTTRPLITGLDTLASAATSVVVPFGDSLTDGDQEPNPFVALKNHHLPSQDTETIDKNARYPDFLARRLAAANRPVFVANTGIAGNMVRLPSLFIFAGRSALSRLDEDVLAVPGATDVIFWEGINDIGQTPFLTAKKLTDAYVTLIARMHAAGLHVIQATLTPSGGSAMPTYGSRHAQALRHEVNEWIRTQSPADSIVDFDAVVRSSSNPDLIDPAYDGGDGLHFNAIGYAKLADAIDLTKIQGNACQK